MHNELHNRKVFKNYRKDLRSNGTSAEAVLWTYLQAKKLNGRKFRRQQSIANYIVDFYCPKEKLIIELDGKIHNNVGSQVADEDRDAKLTTMGFIILRFENAAVFENIEVVLEEISSKFKKESS